jgi:apolipoprotein D and lipocalin family protein
MKGYTTLSISGAMPLNGFSRGPHFRSLEKVSKASLVSLLHLFIVAAMVVMAFSLQAIADEKLPPLETVPHVDLDRYMGKWYEIASFPQWFQKGCVATTATYTLRKDGDVDVLNQCREKTLDGKEKRAKGKAWVVDEKSNAKLKVRFFWPFSGDYWIIDLGDDYQYAVVGHPKRKYLWILSRTPQMDQQAYDTILAKLGDLQYDLTPLQKTLQPAEGSLQ